MFHLIHWIVDYLHPQGFCIDRPNGMDMYTILLFKQSITIWQDGTFIQTGENGKNPVGLYEGDDPYH